MKMIHYLTILLILTWPFGQLLSGVLNLVAALLFISLVLNRKLHQKIISDPLFKPLVSFVAIAMFSLVVNYSSISFISIAYLARFIIYSSIYFVFSLQGTRRYSALLIFSATLFLVFGLTQYFFLPDTRFLFYLGFDDHYYRLIGALFDPNFTGLVLVIFALLLPQPLSLISLVALTLTFSRASFLSFGVGLVYLIFMRRQLKLTLALCLIAFLLYFVPKPFGEGVNLFRTFSIISRLEDQKHALLLFVEKPIFGHGFNIFKQNSDTTIPNLTSGPSNSFLFVLTTTGVIGLLAFVNLLVSIWRNDTSSTIKASFLAIAVHSLFNNSFFYVWILVLVLLLSSFNTRESA